MTSPGNNEALDLFGPIVEFMTPHDEEQLCVMRLVMPSGGTIPLHSHTDFGDLCILSGRCHVLVEDSDDIEWCDAHAGDYIRVPSDAMHALRNVSEEPAVALFITTPHRAAFFREVGRPVGSPPPTAVELARFAEIAERYGYRLATPEENAAVGIMSSMLTV